MPKIDSRPATLRPYLDHGVDLTWGNSDDQAIGDCLFCGREGKFSVNIETGQARCLVCAEGTDKGGMNALVFLRLLHKISYETTTAESYRVLAEDRRVGWETLMEWGVAVSVGTRGWVVPGYATNGEICNLYRYGDILKSTSTMNGGIFYSVSPTKSTVYVCEGPWDGMALWEALGSAKETEDGLASTANRAASLLADVDVVAIPGCGSVGEPFRRWLPLFQDRDVVLFFDNDHPREINGREVDGAGYLALKRAANLLAPVARSIRYMKWGEDRNHDLTLDHGMDVRDLLSI